MSWTAWRGCGIVVDTIDDVAHRGEQEDRQPWSHVERLLRRVSALLQGVPPVMHGHFPSRGVCPE
jgi:hypothetical protein